MSPEQEAKHTARVTNLVMAMMEAQGHDRTNCACGVAIMASVLVGQDQDAKTMLAHTMLKSLVNSMQISFGTQRNGEQNAWERLLQFAFPQSVRPDGKHQPCCPVSYEIKRGRGVG